MNKNYVMRIALGVIFILLFIISWTQYLEFAKAYALKEMIVLSVLPFLAYYSLFSGIDLIKSVILDIQCKRIQREIDTERAMRKLGGE